MAIPTQFSVTKTRKCPISNPALPIDDANALTAEDVGFISGASVLPAKATGDIDTPNELTAESTPDIDSAVVIGSEQKADIDTPSELSAEASSVIALPSELTAQNASEVDIASLFSALSVGTINNPSVISAESVAPVDSASELSAKTAADIDAPSFTIVDVIQWDFNNSLNGWSPVNATLTPNASTMTAVMTGADFQLVKDGFEEGARGEHVLWIKLRCTTATINTRISAFTRNSNHGYSTSFMVQSEPTEMPQGVYVDFYLNLGEIQDYLVDGMTSLRIDPYEGSLQSFEIDRIWLGRYKTDISARDESEIDAASTLAAENASGIDTPSELTAQAADDIDNALPLNALSAGTINNPSIITAESTAAIDSDISLVNDQAFNFANTDNGWIAVNGTLATAATTITVTSTAAGLYIYRDSVNYNKASSYIVRIRMRCTTDTIATNVRVYYENSQHGFEQEYSLLKNTPFVQGEYQILDFNLRGDDFNTFGATGIRINLYGMADTQSFEIDYIHIGAYDSEFEAKPAKEIDLPEAASPESANSIDLPGVIAAEIEQTINTPSAATTKSQPSIELPSAATAESEPSISAPSALTSNAGTQTSGTFPLTHARILYSNVLFSYSNVTQNKGVNSQLAIVPNTWQRWEFSGGGAMTITLPEAVAIDTFCVGAHNLGDYSYSVGVEWSADDSGAWVALAGGKNPNTNGALFFYTQTPVLAKRIRLTCSGDGFATYIGYVSAGVSLQMQRPFFNGHQPYTDSDVTEYYSNRTESGNIIGRQIRRRGYETTFEWQNIDDAWYRSNIPSLKESAKKHPMFIAWNLLEYPDDVAFGETTGDISTSMQNGTRIKRTGLSFTLKGV